MVEPLSTHLAERPFPDRAMELEVVEVDLAVKVDWFRETAPHVAYRVGKEGVFGEPGIGFVVEIQGLLNPKLGTIAPEP